MKTKLIRPAVTVGAATLTFPVEIESGCYLEFRAPGDCKLYGPQGELVREVKPEGEVPLLAPGPNQVTFRCDTPPGTSARAYVTVMSQGKPLGPH